MRTFTYTHHVAMFTDAYVELLAHIDLHGCGQSVCSRFRRLRSLAKVSESPLPPREMAKPTYVLGRVVTDLVDTSHTRWKDDLTSSHGGNCLWVCRMKEVYQSNLEKTKSMTRGGKVNLRNMASKLREPKPEDAFILATWWGNNAEAIKARLGARYEAMLGRFLRGLLA